MALDLHLIDAPLMHYRTRRSELIAKMAKDLIRYEAYAYEPDAIRSLYGRGYPMADIVMLVDEARMLAFQEIVAEEMGRS
jgi:hypothetical protein